MKLHQALTYKDSKKILFIRAASLVGLEKIIAASISLFSNHFYANAYGPSEFGRLQYFLSLVFILGSFGLVASAQSILPLVSRYPRRREEIIGAAFKVRMLASFCAFLFGALVFYYFNFKSLVFLVLLLMVFVEPFAVAVILLIAEARQFFVSLAKIVASLVRFIWIYFSLKFSCSAWFVVIAWPLEAMLSVLIPYVWYRNESHKSKFNKKYIALVIERGRSLLLGIIVLTLVSRVDRVVLRSHMSSEDYGIYSAAMALIDQWNLVGTTIVMVLSGSFIFKSNVASKNKGAYQLALLMFFLSSIGCLIIYIFSDKIFGIIYGDEFGSGVKMLKFFSFISVFIFVDGAFTLLLLDKGRGRVFLIKNLNSLFVISGAPFFVPTNYVEFSCQLGMAISIVIFWSVYFARTKFYYNK